MTGRNAVVLLLGPCRESIQRYKHYQIFRSRVHHLNTASGDSTKKRVIFLGTPAVAVDTLSRLIEASLEEDSLFEVVAVVTKHVDMIGHKAAKPHPRDPHPAMQQVCKRYNLPKYSPVKPNDPEFLNEMSALEPDLCITAAYGHYLPPSFLKLPKFGTLNIHPSLLPRYRGAAPVQRSLENGDVVTGVSVLYSVKRMDAGPLLAQSQVALKGDEKCNELLNILFRVGINDLISRLPDVFQSGSQFRFQSAMGRFGDAHHEHLSSLPHVQLQFEADATEAPKLKAEEAQVDFSQMSALEIHNRCRGFSEWPGVWSHFYMASWDSSGEEVRTSNIKIKLITTRVMHQSELEENVARIIDGNNSGANNEVCYQLHKGKVEGDGRKKGGCFYVSCGGGGFLALEEIQPVGKKVMKAKNFFNGLRGRKLFYARS